MMMETLWVMMEMYVLFVAPSLTLIRHPCVTSVDCIDTHICGNVTIDTNICQSDISLILQSCHLVLTSCIFSICFSLTMEPKDGFFFKAWRSPAEETQNIARMRGSPMDSRIFTKKGKNLP